MSRTAAVPSSHAAEDSLADIIENAERIAAYVAGKDQAALAADGMLRDALERCLERICEATVRLGDSAENLMPGHPWRDIRAMGNRLRHAYDRLDATILWNTTTQRVPALAADARSALRSLADGLRS
ncbi:MAG: DUF86 domain-containing protein [Acetobacteraceae bacterium]|nr:DUF86 domain-containing protein [Acetobacteraceae bacterium]